MQGDHVCGCHELREANVRQAQISTFPVWFDIKPEELTPEAGPEDFCNGPTNSARTDQSDRLAMKIESDQTLQRKVTFTHLAVGTVDSSVERQDQSNRV